MMLHVPGAQRLLICAAERPAALDRSVEIPARYVATLDSAESVVD